MPDLRAIGTGTVSFGLVSIPVKLYSASEPGVTISFNMLHAACGSRVKQQYICTKESVVVPRNEMAKGYEFSKDQYVLFSEDEIKALMEEANKAIEISEFVPIPSVDPLYYDGAYYLGPDKGGERPYRLLSEAMTKTERAAVAKWISKGKQHLVLIRPMEGGLVMQELRYAEEIRDFSEVGVPDAAVKDAELKLGIQLIEQIAAKKFDAKKYRDEVRDRMQAAIARKVEGQEIVAAPAEEPKAQIVDLMEALKASLASSGAAGGDLERKGPRRAPASERATSAPSAAEKADKPRVAKIARAR